MFSKLTAGFLSFATVFVGANLVHGKNAVDELETVDSVDLDRYLGKWYEIARLNEAEQDNCTATTAEYSRNGDGSVKVLNSCRLFNPERGFLKTVTGKAVPADATNSKLLVEFRAGGPQGNYWIIELDADYQWAVVGEPSRSAFFVLSRSRTMDEALLGDILQRATSKHGYDLSNLIRTRHPAH
ncbi:MAG: lipocalin family protein [Deltaproteobacteria bacterium]|nr:lipocalin family protein [Deltaproteobacteria bacterium]